MNVFEQTKITKAWDYTAGRYQYSFQFVFTTKAQYLEFRSGWREHYRKLSEEIRALKRTTREAQRTASRAPSELIQQTRSEAARCQQTLRDRQEEARLQMAMRAGSKVLAQQQYAARRKLDRG